MSAFGIPFDRVVRTEANPVGQRAILPLRLGKGNLGSERLLRWLEEIEVVRAEFSKGDTQVLMDTLSKWSSPTQKRRNP